RTGSSAEASTDHSASINDYLSGSTRLAGTGLCVGENEAQEGVLRPVAVVAGGGIGLGEEGAVAALGSLDEGDTGVRHDLVASIGRDPDEGVIEGVEDERGNGDFVDDAG